MATTTHAIGSTSTSNTTSYGNTEMTPDVTFTPAVNDLIVAFAGYSGSVKGTGAFDATDDQGGTYANIIEAGRVSNAHTLVCLVREAAVSSAVPHTITFTCTGDAATGLVVGVYRVAGMSKYGSTAVLQTAVHENINNSTTSAPTFGSAVDTNNVVFAAEYYTNNAASSTPPAGWTEQTEQVQSTPSAGLAYSHRDSGFTGTTVTWGALTAFTKCAMVVELDTSAAGGAATFAGWYGNQGGWW